MIGVTIEALSAALGHLVWQAAVIGVVTAIGLRLLRHSGAQTRYLLLVCALAAEALAFTVTFFDGLHAPPPMPAVAAGGPMPVGPLLVVGAWALGVLMLGTRTAVAWWHTRALRASATAVAVLDPVLHRCRRILGLCRPVGLGETSAVDVPMVVGALRPMILLPLGLLGRVPPATVEAAIAHELCHVRRLDPLVNVCQAAVCALLFFHPVTWWLSSRIRAERELACDDLVVAKFGDPLRYAVALTDLEQFRQGVPTLSVAATGGSLMNRIERIVESTRSPRHNHPIMLALSVALLGAIAAAPACVGAPDPIDDEDAPEAIEGSAAVPSDELEAVAADADPDADPESDSDEVALGLRWLPAEVAVFAPEITAAGERHGVDPRLIAIVTFVESRGNPLAKSPIGARGLMQLMPATAAAAAAERGMEDHRVDDLDDPQTNLDLGTYVLARALADFGGDPDAPDSVEIAAAAYNGGSKRVRAYLDAGAPLSDETQRYKDLVRALWTERDAPRSATLDRLRAR